MSTPQPDPFWEKVRDFFHRAIALPAGERAALLDAHCPDAAIRAEVESLLASHEVADDFLAASVWQLIDAEEAERLIGARVGPYRLLHPLGRGGMGAVFLAEREGADFTQRVAIKLVRGGAALLNRFRQERQILAALEHSNIARLLDGGTTGDGIPYLVMEYVDGVPIDDYAKNLNVRQRLTLFLQLCEAVQHAHRSLVVHRDIKPANVLVTSDGTVKLLDFGIAKLTNEQLPQGATVTRIMTPDYASPEQLAGKPVTTASDVYSLGVVLFELLTGRRPFAPETRKPDTETVRPSYASGSKGLRGDLDTIVLTAMENDPVRRYGSAEKLSDDIRRYLDGRPITARPSTAFYRLGKFVRRNRVATATALLVVATIVVAFVVTFRQKQIAEHRFDQVRSLAGAVVFELHDSIASLPGSTPARELLVRRALVYLDALASEAGDNPALQAEVARAYLKIGDVQGRPYTPNLGDTAGAMKSYEKALQISASLAGDGKPSREAASLLADAHDRIGFMDERGLRWDAALGRHQKALALRETIASPDSRERMALARTWIGLADCYHIGDRGRHRRKAEESYLRALEILRAVPSKGEHANDLLAELARANQRLGGLYTNPPKDYARALQYHGAALEAMRARLVLQPDNVLAKRNLADQLVMMAIVHTRNGTPEKALEGTEQALAILTPIAEADPRNAEAQADMAFAYEQMAHALNTMEEWPRAIEAAERGLEIRQRLNRADPLNRENRRWVGVMHGILGDAQEGAGLLSAADENRRKAAALIAETAQ